MPNEEEIGTLIVVVLKARNLNDKHFYKQDAYAQLTFNGVSKRTRVEVKGGQHPVWDEEIRFPVMKSTSSKYRQLEASCWAKEHKDDTLLGEAKLDVTQTINSGEFDEWVPLEVNNVSRGEIYLEITYYSNGPAPVNLAAPTNLSRRPSKLSPADRLSRPPVTPPKSYANLEPTQLPFKNASALALPNPIERLSRPPVTPPKSYANLEPSQQGSRTPPKVPSALPESLAPAVPSTLRPGPARVVSSQQIPSASAQPSRLPKEVPSILRPGNPQSDHTHHHARTHSASSSTSPTPYFGYDAAPQGQTLYNPIPVQSISNPTNSHSRSSSSPALPPAGYRPAPVQGPYSGGSTPPANSGYHQVPTYAPTNSSVPDEEVNLSFPVPSVSSGPPFPAAAPSSLNSSYYAQPYPPEAISTNSRNASYPPQQPLDFSDSSTDLPDPYLMARYRTPLPLPQTELTSAPHPQPPSVSGYYRTPSPELPPLPVPQVANQPARSHTPLDESRLRVLRQAEEEAARRKAQEEQDLDLARQLDQEFEKENALPLHEINPPAPPPKSVSSPPHPRVAEIDAAAQRRAQEEKDLELARQLDLELNLNA